MRLWNIKVWTPDDELVTEHEDIPQEALPDLLSSIGEKMSSRFDDDELYEYYRPDQRIELTFTEED